MFSPLTRDGPTYLGRDWVGLRDQAGKKTDESVPDERAVVRDFMAFLRAQPLIL